MPRVVGMMGPKCEREGSGKMSSDTGQTDTTLRYHLFLVRYYLVMGPRYIVCFSDVVLWPWTGLLTESEPDRAQAMAPTAGKKNGGARGGAASTNPNRTASAKAAASGPNMRTKSTINRLNMYRSKVKRNKSGKIVKGGLAVGETVREMKPARVQPDRRWFGNTRVVGQKELQDFREQVSQTTADPYAVLLRRHKLPMGLLAEEKQKKGRVDLLRAQSYADTFGGKAQRKRPRLVSTELAELAAVAGSSQGAYREDHDSNIQREIEMIGPKNYIFDAGQSRRIRAELFKVISPPPEP